MRSMEDDSIPKPLKRSAIAEDLASLQSAVRKLSEERERLPQPFFWSLFSARLAAIKKHKEIERTLASVLGESEL